LAYKKTLHKNEKLKLM